MRDRNAYQRQYRAHKDRTAEYLKYKYGIDVETYNAKLEEQDGKCAICGKGQGNSVKSKLFVDHDHTTGKIRGLLCDSCNRGIGLLQDDADLLMAAVAYLISHQANSEEVQSG